MKKKITVQMPPHIIAAEGVCVSCGVISAGENDGLEFVFLSNSVDKNTPLIAIPTDLAILAIKQIADTILVDLEADNSYSEFLQSKLLDVSDIINEIHDKTKEFAGEDD